MAPKEQVHDPLATSKVWLDVLKFIIPVLLTIVIGYGTIKFTSGETQQRINNLEAMVMELKRQTERDREQMNLRYITRDELRVYMDAQTATLNRIYEDVRALRNSR